MAQATLHWSPAVARPLSRSKMSQNTCLRAPHGRGGCLVVYAEARDLRRDSVQVSNGVQRTGKDFTSARDDGENDGDSSLRSREQRLYERQERLYEREMERWDRERQYWHQREAMLLQHISKLHTGLLALAQVQAKGLPAPEEGEEAIPLGEPGEDRDRARAALMTDRDAYDATDSAFEIPTSDSPSTSPPSSPRGGSAGGVRSRLELRNDGGNGMAPWPRADEGLSLTAQLESAMAAVDKVDILREEVNFLEVDYSGRAESQPAREVPSFWGDDARAASKTDAPGLSARDEEIIPATLPDMASGAPPPPAIAGGLHGRALDVGDDEEDELEKQMLKALEEIAQMVGESEMAVGDILKNTEPPREANDADARPTTRPDLAGPSPKETLQKSVRSFFEDDDDEPANDGLREKERMTRSFFDDDDDAPGTKPPVRSFFDDDGPAKDPPAAFFFGEDEPAEPPPERRSFFDGPAAPQSRSYFEEKPAPPPPAGGQPSQEGKQAAAGGDSGPVAIPTLVMGADDVFWMSQLHSGLDQKGYFCGDEEVEDMYFGDGTFSALITFQACSGLPETGVCNLATWRALLGEQLDTLRPPPSTSEKSPAAGRAAASPTSIGTASPPSASLAESLAPPPPPPSATAAAPALFPEAQPGNGSSLPAEAPSKPQTRGKRLWAALFASDTDVIQKKAAPPPASPPPPAPAQTDRQAHVGAEVVTVSETSSQKVEWTHKQQTLEKWPILREGDGGVHVHQLHVALSRRGYSCGEDDEVWWQFGDMTYSALLSYQACEQLPESGVADAETWASLLGREAHPSVIGSLRHGDHRDDDMLGKHHEGMVFLIGEQRWARKFTK